MNRVNAQHVVEAYKITGLIPIRQAWTTTDARGGCALDALARATTTMNGEEYAKEYFEELYIKGFVDAWDHAAPMTLLDQDQKCNTYLAGFWDAMVARDMVTKEFESIEVVETTQGN